MSDTVASGSWRVPISYGAAGSAVLVGDVFIIVLSSLLAGTVYHYIRLGYVGDLVHYLGIGVVSSLAFTAVMRGKGLYESASLLTLTRQLRAVALYWSGVLVTFAVFALLLRVNFVFSRGAVLMIACTGLVGLLGHRVLWTRALASARVQRRFRGPRIALVTLRPAGDARSLLRRHGYQVVQDVDLGGVDERALPEALTQAFNGLRGRDVEEVYIAAGHSNITIDDAFLEAFRVLPLPVRLVPAPAMANMLRRPSRTMGHNITVDLHRGPLDPVEKALKRGFDIVFAGLGLIVLSPLLCLVALAVRLDSPGPVFFRQSRTGFNGRSFRILKFRSMSVMEDGAAVAQARRFDARVTRVGRWIRRTSIDELPQLLNVLRGEMSLVGPRPHALAHDTQFNRVIGNYAFRHHMKPGLTGWAQVSGHRGETETIDAMSKRVEHDLWYIDHWTFWLDVTIIVRTALGMLNIKNVY